MNTLYGLKKKKKMRIKNIVYNTDLRINKLNKLMGNMLFLEERCSQHGRVQTLFTGVILPFLYIVTIYYYYLSTTYRFNNSFYIESIFWKLN